MPSIPEKDDNIKKDIEDAAAGAKSALERFLGDISKASAAQQLLLGTASGWCTGIVAGKVGKIAAVALGGGIIALQIAQHQGYITVNWDKVMRKVDKVADKVDKNINNEGPSWMDKVDRFVDRKLDKAEDVLKNKKKQARKWYHKISGTGPEFQIEKVHIFACAFVAGVAFGIASS